jgi:preprotein translocase subunit SecD
MEKKRNWRGVFLWILVIFSILYSLPSLVGQGNLPEWYAGSPDGKGDAGIFTKKLNYGLDLQGGLELRYTVDWEEAIARNNSKLADAIKSRIVDELAKKENKNSEDLSKSEWNTYAEKVKIVDVETSDFNEIVLQFDNSDVAGVMEDEEFTKTLDERYEMIPMGDDKWKLRLSDEEAYKIRDQVVEENREVISKRVEAFGLVDPDVRSAGDNAIVVQIPGVGKDQMDMVRQKIGQTALLTLRIVDRNDKWFADAAQMTQVETFRARYNRDNPNAESTIELMPTREEETKSTPDVARNEPWMGPYLRAQKKSELMQFASDPGIGLPEGRMLGFEKVEIRNKKGQPTGEAFWKTLMLFANADITGDHLARASVSPDDTSVYAVTLVFNAEGGRIFADLTEKNVDEYMAIMLDEEVNSAPVIKERIGGGQARITLGSSNNPQQILKECQGLTKVLNQGAYAAPVLKVQDHEVGPSLGADSVASGKFSMALGMLLVVLFMLLYYRGSGIIAVIVLFLNLLFILSLLVSMNAALTLPGMAGIILTIGMAVDANIIIFERIREELAAGRKVRAAVDAGYEKAFSTIIDANITTALAGFILLNYTSGPIRGFAVTLLLGILCSVFTAVYVSRRIFNWWLDSRQPDSLSI